MSRTVQYVLCTKPTPNHLTVGGGHEVYLIQISIISLSECEEPGSYWQQLRAGTPYVPPNCLTGIGLGRSHPEANLANCFGMPREGLTVEAQQSQAANKKIDNYWGGGQ